MRLNYRAKIFLRFGFVFVLFFVGVIFIAQSRQRTIRREALEKQLAGYVSLIDKAAPGISSDSFVNLESVLPLLPSHLRVSIINLKGEVLFDNVIEHSDRMENHMGRIEIVAASQAKQGTDIRTSRTDSVKYLYLAEKIGSRFIRVALPYDSEAKPSLQADAVFVYWALFLLLVMLLLVNHVANSMGRTILRLRDFAFAPDKKHHEWAFPDDELGEVSRRIARNYHELREKTISIEHARERLSQHVLSSREGVCFFTPRREVLFFNGLFLQHLHAVSDVPGIEPATLEQDPLFAPVFAFWDEQKKSFYESKIECHGRVFSLRAGIFEDGGFEIVLNDITENEKMHRLKQEMTGNIAHELRTPVTSIRGYLETLLEQKPDEATRDYFLHQAYRQTLALSDLIRDMSLITKLDESPLLFDLNPVNLSDLLEQIRRDFAADFSAHHISFESHISEDVVIVGNESLLYAIFRNLTENAIRYGGGNIRVVVDLYRTDEAYFYFSFYDTGHGISDEAHLVRIFERFYRIGHGRTRESGGTGLGLSIVKNAVLFHKGEITAKNRAEGGLEFLFRLKRHLSLHS